MSTRVERPVGRGCGAGLKIGRNLGLAAIVRAYLVRSRPYSEEELNSFRQEPTVAAAVERAGVAVTPQGKRYHHQRRLPGALLKKMAHELKHAGLQQAKNFDDLHERVRTAAGTLHGVGELTVYDTALRIGAKLGFLPAKVYLHAGTRAGARALGLKWRGQTLEVRDLPLELRALPPHEIEDVLCIFKDKLRKAV